MAEGGNTDTVGERKVIRPALIASQRNVADDATFLRRLLLGLAEQSLPVALVCPPRCDTERVTAVPVEVFTYPLVDLPVIQRLGIEQLEEPLQKFKPTVLHCLCESRAALTRRLARRLDVPYVLAINATISRLSRLSISSRRCMKILVPTETIRAGVTRGHFRFADRITPVKIGTFVKTDAACFSDPDRLPSIVVAHRMDHVADFKTLLAAIRALLAEGRQFVVVLMGSGRAEHRLWRLIEREGLSQTVTMVGALDPWRSVLAAGDIFVQPQPVPRFSMFLLEAMSVGTVVAACRGGVDDLIVHNETALVFDPDNEISLRRTLAELLDNRESARRLALRAQEYLRIHHCVSDMIAAILDSYMDAQQRYASQGVPA